MVHDADDPRVAQFRRLNDTAHRRQVEAPGPFDKGSFVVEGWLAVERLLPSRYGVRGILVDEARLERLAELVGHRNLNVLAAPRDLLDEIVGFPLHRGVVATADRGRPTLPATVVGRSRALLMTEGVNDAENLGALIRNSVALGGDGLLLDPTSCDPLTRRTVRVSVGHALALPFARGNLVDALDGLRADGVATIALTPSTDAADVSDLDLPADGRRAIVVGAEGPGLTDATLEACTHRARIPMAAGVDSLNVATAAAIAMHRCFRVERGR